LNSKRDKPKEEYVNLPLVYNRITLKPDKKSGGFNINFTIPVQEATYVVPTIIIAILFYNPYIGRRSPGAILAFSL